MLILGSGGNIHAAGAVGNGQGIFQGILVKGSVQSAGAGGQTAEVTNIDIGSAADVRAVAILGMRCLLTLRVNAQFVGLLTGTFRGRPQRLLPAFSAFANDLLSQKGSGLRAYSTAGLTRRVPVNHRIPLFSRTRMRVS